MCRVISCVDGRGCLLWPVFFLGKTLLAFALLHFILQGQTYLLSQVSLGFLLWHSNPLQWKGHFWGVLVLKGLIGLCRTIHLCFFSISIWGIDLDYCDVEWFALKMSQDHSVVFEILPKYYVSDSFIDYEGFSIFVRDSCPQCVLSCFSRVWLLVTLWTCSPPGSSTHGILQARILEWVAMPFSKLSPQPRGWNQVS